MSEEKAKPKKKKVLKFTFERTEKKYLIDDKTFNELMERIRPYVEEDAFGKSTVNTVYYDTENYELIRASIEKPVYKEKLRARSYGVPEPDSKVFLEIKKKFKGVTSKRRVALPYTVLNAYINDGVYPEEYDSQILREIDFFINFYGRPKPAALVSCEREAYYSKTDPELRLTFDSAIRCRTENVDLRAEGESIKIIEDGYRLMEIKGSGAYELWLVKILSDMKIYPRSFSKYGTFYKYLLSEGEIVMYDKTITAEKGVSYV